jgi:hypothetical protein
MKLKDIIYKVLPILFAAFLLSCTRELEQPTTYRTIHYKAQVGNQAQTRATVDGGNHYVFEETDRLYMASTQDPEQLYGILYLTAGAGTGTALFEGDLYCSEEFELSDDTPVKVTLVNNNDRIHSLENGRISATQYPTDQYAPDFATAVKYYSDFTQVSTFGSHDFSLAQNSSFLIFNIRMSSNEVKAGNNVTAQLSSAGQSLWSSTVSAFQDGKLQFVTAFKGGEVSLQSASLTLSWGNDKSKVFQHIANTQLQANNYYTINRSTLDYKGFRIIAIQNGTTVHFNHTGDGLKYSTDGGDTWTEYNEEADIPLNAGQDLCFKGNKSNYKNLYNGSNNKPIFTTEGTKVYIAGHIMSLIAGDEYSDNTPMPEDAFNGAFSKGTDANNTDIAIDSTNPLILPSTVNARCYKNMFRGCVNLLTPPDLPSETVADACYSGIFRCCPNLTSVKCNLRGATKADLENAVDKWLVRSGTKDMINTSGTFYCPESMVDVWNSLHVANISIGAVPTTWTISPYSD